MSVQPPVAGDLLYYYGFLALMATEQRYNKGMNKQRKSATESENGMDWSRNSVKQYRI